MNKVIYINDENINFDIKENETLEIYHYVVDKNVSVNINSISPMLLTRT